MIEQKKKERQTEQLPLVTLRGLTITPSVRVKIPLSRRSSIEAFRFARDEGNGTLALFCQKNDRQIIPKVEDLHPIGIIATVQKLTESSSKNPQNFGMVRGITRVRLLEIEGTDVPEQMRKAKVEILEEKSVDPVKGKEILNLLRSSLQYARENSSQSKKPIIPDGVPDDIFEALLTNEDLSELTDTMAQALKLDKDTKVMLLTSTDPLERAKILICALNNISYKNEIEGRLMAEAKTAMERNQRDYLLNEQMRIIKKELGIDENSDSEVEEFRRRNAALDAPDFVHDRIEREIKKYAVMSYSSSESSVVRNYIETLLSVPWENKTEISTDLKRAKKVLDEDHYGLEKVKDRILEYLAVQSRTEHLHGPIICLMGPPGIGKTSLGQSVANATGRKFIRLSLGGVHDEAEIRGHRRTYIGALPGRIVSNMIKCGVKNPLFLLDEIDKISDSVHGDPAAALLEVLDPEQNKSFEDNYLELEYDLSDVLFVTTANSYNISAPLLDRMEIIDLSSYTEEEKFNIAKQHLIPKEMRLTALTAKEFELSDDALTELIRYYTHEAGVRGLERLINEICRKCIKEKMLAGDNKDGKRVVKAEDLQKLLGPRRYDFTSKLNENKVGLVNGLAWTALGGDILQLEVVANEGKGKHILTGKLGPVMKESIGAAITLVRSKARELHLDPAFYESSDLHVHVPEGATPKEGPSAGVGMVTGIVSALTGNPVRADVAMTGEITLRGDVLPIGGLKEKLLAALRGGIKTALIPAENEKDLYEVPENVKKGLHIVPCKRIEQVLSLALENDPEKFIPTTAWKLGKVRRKASKKKAEVESGAEEK